VRKFLRKRLQLIQKLKPIDSAKRLAFCEEVLGMMARDEGLSKWIIFSDEATFHLSVKVNRHNIRIWGSEKPVAVVEMERDSPRVKVFCAVSRRRVFCPFFFAEKSVTGQVYLKMLQNWLMPQLAEEEYIFQQDGAPPHWHMGVREHLNGTYQVDGLVVHQLQTSAHGHPGHRT
jgi:hypothetical protein